MSKFIIEIALTHDHAAKGQRLPDYFQALFVPLEDDQPDWSNVDSVCWPLLESDAGQIDGRNGPVPIRDLLTDGFNKWLEELDVGLSTGHSLSDADRIEWSLEGPDDCGICPDPVQELVSRGLLP